MNLNLSKGFNTARNIVVSNSPELLVGTAVVGVITTGVLAARGGYKARGIVDAERAKRKASFDSDAAETVREYQELMAAGTDPLDNMTKAKLTWLCYAAPAVTGASTIASVAGVHMIHNKRHAALAGLYAITANKLDDVQAEAEKMLGPKKTQQLQNVTAQKAVDRDPIIDHEVYVTGDPQELMYEEYTGRYFMGSVPIVEKAVAEVNLQLAEGNDVSMNEYFDNLGLKPVPWGHEYGWSGARITPSFGSVNTTDGRAAVSVYFHDTPKLQRG